MTDQLRSALDSLYNGDRVLFFEMLADDYVCHTPGSSPLAGDFVGPEGMRRHGRQMQELSGNTFKAGQRGTMVVGEEHALVPTWVRARRPDGRELDVRGIGLWRFESGRIAEHWEMPLDMATFDAFWSNPVEGGGT